MMGRVEILQLEIASPIGRENSMMGRVEILQIEIASPIGRVKFDDG